MVKMAIVIGHLVFEGMAGAPQDKASRSVSLRGNTSAIIASTRQRQGEKRLRLGCRFVKYEHFHMATEKATKQRLKAMQENRETMKGALDADLASSKSKVTR